MDLSTLSCSAASRASRDLAHAQKPHANLFVGLKQLFKCTAAVGRKIPGPVLSFLIREITSMRRSVPYFILIEWNDVVYFIAH